jgi:AraC-like DNA-binding protein
MSVNRALRNGVDTVSAIAETLEYDSDSAFNNAFKRVMQTSPSAYRRTQHRHASIGGS